MYLEHPRQTQAVVAARSATQARRHLNQDQRQQLIQAELKENPERSNRQIAEGLNVSDHTVKAVRDDLEGTAQIAQLMQTVGKDGKKRETPKKPPKKNKGGRPRKDRLLSSAAIVQARYYAILRARVRSDEERLAQAQALELMKAARPQ